MDENWDGFMRMLMTRFRLVLNEGVPVEKCHRIRDILVSEDNYPKTFLDLIFLLIEIGDELKKAAEFSYFVFLIDEIEAMPDCLIAEVLRFFRSLFGHYAEKGRWKSPYRVVIFTTRDLSYWDLGRGSPFNISSIILLKPFSREEFDTMLNEQHAGPTLPNVIFDESARIRIMTESGGYPYFIQKTCHILVEKYQPDNNEKIVVGNREVLKAVLRFYEIGDDNLHNIYLEASQESNEWQLCTRLAGGNRVTYAANDPPTKNLVELGIIVDVEGYCHFSMGLYKKQILKICFGQEYQAITQSLPDNEQLLLNISCLQKILLNDKIEQRVFAEMNNLKQDKDRTDAETAAELSDYLDRVLKDQESALDMEEIHAYVDYYNIEPMKDRKEALLVLAKAFIGRFNEIIASE